MRRTAALRPFVTGAWDFVGSAAGSSTAATADLSSTKIRSED